MKAEGNDLGAADLSEIGVSGQISRGKNGKSIECAAAASPRA